MKWISMLLLCACFSTLGHAAIPSSYRVAHPVGWMHQLPVGEPPGWSTSQWIQFEVSQNNIWNAPLNLTNRTSGRALNFMADFEQTNFVIEMGKAIDDHLAFIVELAYSQRDTGVFDQFIDAFHIAVGSERFSRNDYPNFDREFSITNNGQNQLNSNTGNGLGNVKFKLKWWLWKWLSFTPGACDCGFSASLHVKMPATSYKEGITSGDTDYSLMWNLGVPLFTQSALWLSSATTFAPNNFALRGWPRRKWMQMYELSSDFALTDNWGLVVQMRLESPIMHKRDLAINYTATTRKARLEERIASGWNSLVYWRGTQALGFRYRSNAYSTLNFLLLEDFAIGDHDDPASNLYVTNAPDVGFLIQWITGL